MTFSYTVLLNLTSSCLACKAWHLYVLYFKGLSAAAVTRLSHQGGFHSMQGKTAHINTSVFSCRVSGVKKIWRAHGFGREYEAFHPLRYWLFAGGSVHKLIGPYIGHVLQTSIGLTSRDEC